MDTVDHHHQADERDGQLTATDVSAAGVDGAKPQPPTRLILLVRHGETTFNVEGRLPGQLPGVPLTDEGRRQAHQAAVALA
ncbi:MAG TPA: histidine phosphatase family protein, partial [Ktedonobacterales bacterium]|nr:histidine phosphatase family protein [Ktedonobacterales bacterium]